MWPLDIIVRHLRLISPSPYPYLKSPRTDDALIAQALYGWDLDMGVFKRIYEFNPPQMNFLLLKNLNFRKIFHLIPTIQTRKFLSGYALSPIEKASEFRNENSTYRRAWL